MSLELDKVKEQWLRYWRVEVQRFRDNLSDMFSDNVFGAMAREDLSHSYVNVFVEFFRYNAYAIGHVVAVVWLPLLIWWLV